MLRSQRSRSGRGPNRWIALLGLLAIFTLAVAALNLETAVARSRGVWFQSDFETGGLEGWTLEDIPRPDSAVVVPAPVRKGRYAVRVSLAPGDRAARKERAELKLADKRIERTRGQEGGEMWYGWSFLLPAEHADPPAGQFQILAQWHHRPHPAAERRKRGRVTGPPPLALYLEPLHGRDVLILIGQPSPQAPPSNLGAQPIRRGAWNDLVFHVRWSTGTDGFVEAWLNGGPFTAGKHYGPTLYQPVSSVLRLGLYRGKGVPTTNHVFLDEIRIGASYRAVAP
jgi:hypothetical protein